MNNEFTKADLKSGDVILRRNGNTEIVCVETGTLIAKDGYNCLAELNDDLADVDRDDEFDVVAIRRPQNPCDCQFNAFELNKGKLVYERKEVKEMTLEEVCKELGREVKIVKSH